MGLYISGSALGGMGGRLLTGVLADLVSWRVALGGCSAALGLVAAVLSGAACRLGPFLAARPAWHELLRARAASCAIRGLPWPCSRRASC